MMISAVKNKISVDPLRIHGLAFLLMLYTLRLAFPYVNYLLIPVLTIIGTFSVYLAIKQGVAIFLKKYFWVVLPLLISLLILLFNYLFLSGFIGILTIEIIHSVSAFLVLFVLIVLLKNGDELNSFFKSLSKQLIVVSGIIGLLGIIKLFYQFKGVYFDFLDIAGYPSGTSLTIDSNFFSLFIVFGIILLLTDLSKKIKWHHNFFYQLVLFILTLNVVLSVSRRGLLVAVVTFSTILVIWILSFVFPKKEEFKNLRKNTLSFFIILAVSSALFAYFVFLLTPNKRNEIILNSPLTKTFSDYITSLVHESKTIYSDSVSYIDVSEKLWKGEFDSRYPYSGWGTGNYTPVKEIAGKNFDIVPEGSVGYRLDKTASWSSWKGNAYSYTKVFNGTALPGKRYIPSVYCYVSEDFNGDWVRISSQGKLRGLKECYYDLSKKEEWQKLQLSFEGDSTNFNVYLSFVKNKINSIDSLMGYVIFAYPTLDSLMFNPKIPLSWASVPFQEVYPLKGPSVEIVPEGSKGFLLDKRAISIKSTRGVYSSSSLFNYKTKREKRYISTIYVFVSNNFSGSNVRLNISGNMMGNKNNFYDLSQKGVWQKLYLNSIGKGGNSETTISFSLPDKENFSELEGYIIFAYPEYKEIDYNPVDPSTYYPISYYKKVSPLIGQGIKNELKGSIGFQLDRSISGHKFNNDFYSRIILDETGELKNDTVKASIYCYVSEDFNGNVARLELNGGIAENRVSNYNLKRKGEWQKLERLDKGIGRSMYTTIFVSQSHVSDFNNLEGKVIFAYPQLMVKKNGKWIEAHKIFTTSSKLNEEKKKEPEIELNDFSVEDTASNDSLSVQGYNYIPSSNKFSGPRLDRWRYAWYLYTKEYKWWQKIVGGGFEHTNKFAKTFDSPKGYDYPHNPFISVLLYSGIIGLLAYFWLLYKVFFYYWLYRKDYWPWFLCFLATFFYSFFSANSPFDPAVMALFMVLPFAIHAINNKGELEVVEKKQDSNR